jgi:hypothetical protein
MGGGGDNGQLTREFNRLHKVVKLEFGKDAEAVIVLEESEPRPGGPGR